jgi:hypothetical protein
MTDYFCVVRHLQKSYNTNQDIPIVCQKVTDNIGRCYMTKNQLSFIHPFK